MGLIPRRSLSADEVEERPDEFVDAVLWSRRTAAGPAFDRDKQEFVLRWLGVIARSNAEMACQFAALASRALERMEPDALVDGYAELQRGMEGRRGIIFPTCTGRPAPSSTMMFASCR